MDFFNKLTQKAKITYGVASKKTGEIAKEAKLKMKMNENKSEINNLYKEIGKKVYERHTMSGEINIKVDLEEECTKIDVLSAEIQTCLNEIRELKDKKQCSKCFNEIDLEANFCSYCGEKQDKTEAVEVEIVNTQNAEDSQEVITQEETNANELNAIEEEKELKKDE